MPTYLQFISATYATGSHIIFMHSTYSLQLSQRVLDSAKVNKKRRSAATLLIGDQRSSLLARRIADSKLPVSPKKRQKQGLSTLSILKNRVGEIRQLTDPDNAVHLALFEPDEKDEEIARLRTAVSLYEADSVRLKSTIMRLQEAFGELSECLAPDANKAKVKRLVDSLKVTKNPSLDEVSFWSPKAVKCSLFSPYNASPGLWTPVRRKRRVPFRFPQKRAASALEGQLDVIKERTRMLLESLRNR